MKKVRIHRLPLAVSTAVSCIAFGVGERRGFYDWHRPFDMNEHALHLAPGLGIGFLATYLASKIEVSRKRALNTGIGVAALAGFIFETGVFDGIYRDTTHSFYDAAWTALAGTVGAYCVREDITTETS